MKDFLRCCCALMLLGTSTVLTAHDGAEPVPAKVPDKKQKSQPSVEVVFVLDTTGSMGGLIAAAKEKVWAIANTLATAKPTPVIKMGLVGYRDRGDAYITKITPLNTDLDTVYKDLMGFQAAGGGDGPESVNQALHEAVKKIDWSRDEKTYRVIFLVGDAPPHTDYANDVQYPEVCEKAARADIVINTIQCGNVAATTPVWTTIAQLAEGKYFRVEQSGGAILASTPFDEDLARLSRELGETRLFYGETRFRRAAADKAEAADEAAAAAPAAAKAGRAAFQAKEAGSGAFGGEADLVGAIQSKRLDLDDLEAAKLPEKLQKMTPEERKQYVERLSAKRRKLQKQIEELSATRQAHIRAELEKNKTRSKDSLDEAIFESIQHQAASKGLKYMGGPVY